MKQRRKIYYVSGMISLLFLPMALCLYVNKQKGLEKLYALKVFWGFGYFDDQNTKEEFYKAQSARKFIDVKIDNNRAQNSIKLSFARIEIRDLMNSRDTLHGVHFHLENNSPYQALVEIINILEAEKVTTYVAEGDNIWIFNYPTKPVENDYLGKPLEVKMLFSCGTSAFEARVFEESNDTEWSFIKQNRLFLIIASLLCYCFDMVSVEAYKSTSYSFTTFPINVLLSKVLIVIM
jgi:hypothetical protein